jgi:pyridoxine 4-dehydrogenase
MATTQSEKPSSTFSLGNELAVERMGYGAMQLTGPGVWGDPADRPNAIKLLLEAVLNGVNFIDTANAYGPETNEILIADALYPYAHGLIIATKGGLERTGPGQWIPNGEPNYIRQAIDDSLKRLRVDQIDLWQLHRIDANFPVEETLRPVADAVDAGKIRFVGLSEVDVPDIERAEKIVPIVSVQNNYNLGNRKWDSLVDYTRKRGMAFIPFFPLAAGPDRLAAKVQKIADKHQATVAQIALAWLMQRSENILLIPGTKSLEHLDENLQAKTLQLTDQEFQELSQ